MLISVSSAEESVWPVSICFYSKAPQDHKIPEVSSVALPETGNRHARRGSFHQPSCQRKNKKYPVWPGIFIFFGHFREPMI